MRLILTIAFSLALTMIANGAPYQAKKGEDVIRIPDAIGEGNTTEEALQNAFTEAVQRAIGAYTTANEKLNDKGDAIREIATFSNGYIVWYEKLDLRNNADGKKRVLIACDVSRSRTVARLEKAGVKIPEAAIGKVDGKRLFADEVSRNKRNQDAVKLLSEVLSNIPTTKDMLRGAKLLPRKPDPRKSDDGSKYFCEVFFRMEYDYSMLTKYCKWVDKTLQHAGFTDRYERTISHRYANQYERGYWQDDILLNAELNRRDYSTFLDLHNVVKYDEEQGALVLLTHFECNDEMDINDIFGNKNAYDNKPHVKTTWVVYKLERRLLQKVEREIYRKAFGTTITYQNGYKQYLNFNRLQTNVSVQFLSPDKRPIATENKTYDETVNFYLDHLFEPPVNLEDNGNALVVSFMSISPRISLENPNKYCTVKLKLNDLEVIEDVKITIAK